MSINKTYAISSSISFLTSLDTGAYSKGLATKLYIILFPHQATPELLNAVHSAE